MNNDRWLKEVSCASILLVILLYVLSLCRITFIVLYNFVSTVESARVRTHALTWEILYQAPLFEDAYLKASLKVTHTTGIFQRSYEYLMCSHT